MRNPSMIQNLIKIPMNLYKIGNFHVPQRVKKSTRKGAQSLAPSFPIPKACKVII